MRALSKISVLPKNLQDSSSVVNKSIMSCAVEVPALAASHASGSSMIALKVQEETSVEKI